MKAGVWSSSITSHLIYRFSVLISKNHISPNTVLHLITLWASLVRKHGGGGGGTVLRSTPAFVFCSRAPSGPRPDGSAHPEETLGSARRHLTPDQTGPWARQRRILWHAPPAKTKYLKNNKTRKLPLSVRISHKLLFDGIVLKHEVYYKKKKKILRWLTGTNEKLQNRKSEQELFLMSRFNFSTKRQQESLNITQWTLWSPALCFSKILYSFTVIRRIIFKGQSSFLWPNQQ